MVGASRRRVAMLIAGDLLADMRCRRKSEKALKKSWSSATSAAAKLCAHVSGSMWTSGVLGTVIRTVVVLLLAAPEAPRSFWQPAGLISASPDASRLRFEGRNRAVGANLVMQVEVAQPRTFLRDTETAP